MAAARSVPWSSPKGLCIALTTAIHSSLPDGIVGLHHPQGRLDRKAVERPAEGAERRLVVRTREQRNSLVVGAPRLGREVEPRLVLEVDRVEPLERDRARLERSAGDPDRALAGHRWVVDPADQVPGDLSAVARRPDSGGPLPRRVAAVVARRVVGDAEALQRAGPPPDPDLAVHRHPRRLAGPGIAALAVRTHALDRVSLVELELELDGPGSDPHQASGHLDLAAPTREVPAGPLPQTPPLPVPDAPERHRDRADSDDRREDDQIVRERPDPAPALAHPPTQQQRHRIRRNGQLGSVLSLAAPGEPGHLLGDTIAVQPRKRRISPAICSPRSSCRKWAAPSILTCSVTVGIHSAKRSPERGNGNTGSLSEKATSAGFSHCVRASTTARISSAPATSSSVMSRSGN